MKSEDFNSFLSPYTSRAIEYFKSTNPTGIASLIVSIVWVICGLAVVFGYSVTNAIGLMVASYLLARVVGHFDESSEEQLKTGKYGEIAEHNPDDEYTCTNCSQKKTAGNLRISYNVYYLFDYEIARTERSRNMKCKSCEENEQVSEDMEVEMQAN